MSSTIMTRVFAHPIRWYVMGLALVIATTFIGPRAYPLGIELVIIILGWTLLYCLFLLALLGLSRGRV